LGRQHPKIFGKKGSKILKLRPVRNLFKLAMKNKLVFIMNSLKVPKIKKILLYEMKFLVPNYSCPQNHWLGSYRPQIPVPSVLCPQLNLFKPPPPEKNSWVRHWFSGYQETVDTYSEFRGSRRILKFNQVAEHQPTTDVNFYVGVYCQFSSTLLKDAVNYRDSEASILDVTMDAEN